MSHDTGTQEKIQKITDGLHSLMAPDMIIRAMETEDEVGRILRMHLLVEQMIEIYLEWSIADEMKPVVSVPHQFSQKVTLATALGLPPQIAVAANSLNKIRNRVAHRLGATLQEGDVRDFALAVDKVRETLDITVVPLAESSVEVASTGRGKVAFGTAGTEWDFRIASGFLQGWFRHYLSRHCAEKIQGLRLGKVT